MLNKRQNTCIPMVALCFLGANIICMRTFPLMHSYVAYLYDLGQLKCKKLLSQAVLASYNIIDRTRAVITAMTACKLTEIIYF